MHEAMLYEKLPSLAVRCHVCQWRCVINSEKTGRCRMRHNREGTLEVLNYGRVSSMTADPIEKKPLFHFYPASQAFSLGGWGCNFRCKHCQNWQISHQESRQSKRVKGRESRVESWGYGAEDSRLVSIPPEETIRLTKQYNCDGISWTYNEPCIWLEYTLDSARLAKEEKLYTVYVTNGFSTEEALDTMGPYLDAWRVDLKGFSDSLYQGLARVIRWRKILDVARRAQDKWGMHVEVVTNIIPTLNDDDEQLEGIANWIRDELGELTPWHITRFYPHYEMQHLPPTPVSTIERAAEIGRSVGLRFVYVGNIPGHAGESTICYSCGKLVVERMGYHTRVLGLNGSRCLFCSAELNFRVRWTGIRS
ncbi:MAG: Pyruvate formate-lyase 1-activating enzyme [Chloroflexi bacterium]|nr:Pyruvate formate-lyase 1-activating enzyme [Chloroflexota bacterium]